MKSMDDQLGFHRVYHKIGLETFCDFYIYCSIHWRTWVWSYCRDKNHLHCCFISSQGSRALGVVFLHIFFYAIFF